MPYVSNETAYDVEVIRGALSMMDTDIDSLIPLIEQLLEHIATAVSDMRSAFEDMHIPRLAKFDGTPDPTDDESIVTSEYMGAYLEYLNTR